MGPSIPFSDSSSGITTATAPARLPMKHHNSNSTSNNNNSTMDDLHHSTTSQEPPSLRPSASGRMMPRRSTMMHRTVSSLASYRTTSITKHYALNNQILAAFELHYESKLYTIAYAIGLQFVETALLEIPKHGYFYSSRHCQERMTNSLNAIRVTNMLTSILHDVTTNNNHAVHLQELGLDLSQEIQKVKKLSDLAIEIAEEGSNFEGYEKDRAQVEADLTEMKRQESSSFAVLGDIGSSSSSKVDGGFCAPLWAVGDALAETMCPPNQPRDPSGDYTTQTLRRHDSDDDGGPPAIPRDPSGLSPPTTNAAESAVLVGKASRGSLLDDGDNFVALDDDQHTKKKRASSIIPPPPPLDNGGWSVIPDAIPQRPAFGRQMSDQSYADHVALERALYLSGLEVQPEETDFSHVDEQFMLEQALKESAQEMKRQEEEEEKQFMQMVQESEKQHKAQQMLTMMNHATTSSSEPAPPQLQRRMTKTRLETQTLYTLYHEDFVALCHGGRIRVTHIETYQGKNPGSTNGCTVIAPLLCIHHFINYGGGDGEHGDPGLPDSTVMTVIDEEVPSLLPKVREEYGVVQDAFLIPADSHDYLLKNQLLSSDQFVTCCGGNIMDQQHLEQLIQTLQDGGPPEDETAINEEDSDGEKKTSESSDDKKKSEESSSKSEQKEKPKRKDGKIACTLFFHEHVISILKLKRPGGKAWYDLLDSLPNRKMLSKEVTEVAGAEGSSDRLGAPSDSVDGLIGGGVPRDEFGFSLSDMSHPPMDCARIRCLDEEALQVAIRWYAFSKFSPENLNYIDNYRWDDNNTDFDPRVFQAFVWTEAQ